MSDIVDELNDTEKLIAQTVWSNIAHLMGDYSEVPFDQVLVRPRYQGLRGTLRHLARRLDELTILASDHSDLIAVVAELGIEDSSTTPAEAVRELKTEVERLRAQVERQNAGYRAIMKATIEGRVCDDVAWFDTITTLHDFCANMLTDAA